MKSTPKIPGILAEMTLEDVRELAPEVVVLPIGSTEPHGPHLPYGTDTYATDDLCRNAVLQANAGGARVLLYPTLPIGNNVNMKAFPFACRIGVRTLMTVIHDIVQALEEDGIRKIVIVNWHGGNTDTVHATIREHVERRPPDQGAFLCLASLGNFVSRETWALIDHPADHAGEAETSMMLHLRPDLVRPDKFNDFPVNQPELKSLAARRVFYVRPWHGLLPESAGGETRTSTAEKGAAIMEEAAAGLAEFLIELSAVPWRTGFPFPRAEG